MHRVLGLLAGQEQESDRSGESDNLMVSTDEGDDDQVCGGGGGD
jgi:hypothetical protein